MKKVTIFLLIVLISANAGSQPIPGKLNHTVIIDTDCAIDDLRAISLLLSRPEITIEAILLSDGSLPPNEGVQKIRSLLHAFNRDNIPIAAGDELKGIDPPWREFNRKISWGNLNGSKLPMSNALNCLTEKLSNAEEKILLICLGPLTNIAGLVAKDNMLLSKIERVVWYNDDVKPLKGFNYVCDTAGANKVIRSGIRMDIISNLDKEDALFDTSLVRLSKKSNTMLAKEISYVYSQPPVAERLKQNHFRLCDDLVVLYVTNPELFDVNPMLQQIKLRFNNDYNVQGVREAIGDMIRGNYVKGNNVIFNNFPDQREMFNYDIRPIMDSAIARYGYDEWKANVITDEFHGHLGVFSIVGAKMGIKARELYHVGPDMLKVVTFAGSKPPYSCLTDGIQVSTGATLGMGTIQLASDSITRPSAVFTYKGRSIRITLKKEYLEKVDADIKDGIVKFGLMDDGYWKLIRRNAITYWLEWDRNKIFDIEEMATLSAFAREDSVKRITSLQASKMIEMDRDIVVIDVRTPAEYDAGHIKDAVNIDIKQPDAFSKIDTLDSNGTYIVHCRINHRSQIAVDHMKNKGFKNIYQITDGYAGWSQNGLPEVKLGSSTSAP